MLAQGDFSVWNAIEFGEFQARQMDHAATEPSSIWPDNK
jgi:hypothetical protein